MACGITAINQSVGQTDCGSIGGIFQSYGIACDDISDITIAADGNGDNWVSAITLASTKSFSKLVYDDDDTASYNEEPDRQGKRITYNQTSFMKFEKLSNAKRAAAKAAAECCCTVWIHFANSGPEILQGVDETATGWQFSKNNAKVSPGLLTDTGDNADRLEYTVESVGRVPSLYVDPSINLDTLVGS